MLLSKCAVCDSKKLKFIKELEASGLWNSEEIKEIVNKILLAGDKCIPEMHLRNPNIRSVLVVNFQKLKNK